MRMGRTRTALLLVATSPASTLATAQEVALDPQRLGLNPAEASALERAITSGTWPVAEAILYEAAQADPDNPARQRALGIAHFQAGRAYSAAAALKRADSSYPLDSEARFLLASAFLRLERRHWARAELELLVETHADRDRYRLALARIHYDQQRFQDGVELLRRGIEAHGSSAEALDLLGQCLEGLGRHEEAAQAFRTAIAIGEPQSPWPHFHLGSLLHDLGRLESAEEALRIATDIGPENGPAHKELGIVLHKAGKLRASSEALETAARLAPGDVTIHYALAGVYRKLGFEKRSDASMRRFQELSNTDGRAEENGAP